MSAELHWTLVDRDGTLVALVRSKHFVPLPDICLITRRALNLSPISFLTDKKHSSVMWYTWLSFELCPAIEIFLENPTPSVPSDIKWGWTEINPCTKPG